MRLETSACGGPFATARARHAWLGSGGAKIWPEFVRTEHHALRFVYDLVMDPDVPYVYLQSLCETAS